MGAEYQQIEMDHKPTQNELKDIIENAEYDYGHAGYTGSFAECPGFTFSKEKFGSVKDAEDWLYENTQKWEDALIVETKTGQWVIGGVFSS